MENFNLEINDFGIINNANIEINKITIVGGVNDSGKSTACRLLYCFLKSNFLSQKEAVMNLLVDEFNTIFTNPPQDFTVDDDFEYMIKEYEKTKSEVNEYPNGKLKTQNVDSLIKLLKLLESKKINSLYPNSQNKISSVIAKELIYKEGLIRFHGYSKFYSPSFESIIKIDLPPNYKENSFCSAPNYIPQCKNKGDITNSPNVYYIDCFSILNIFNYNSSDLDLGEESNALGLVNHIDSIINDIYELGNIGPIMWDPIYSNVINKIHDLISGDFQPTFFTSDFSFRKEDLIFVPTYNTSSGIKQTGILELLLTKDKLKLGSFLIIDEPEVNLHPDWQFKFAEIIVLLAKEADIKIYINSHSPMFIEAMDAFIEYYDMENDVNYYLTDKSDENEKKYDFNKIDSNELYKIYENLGNGYKLINQLRLRKRLSG